MAYPENRIGLPTGRWWGAMSRQRELMLVGVLAYVCVGAAWALDGGFFAAVFAIEAAFASYEGCTQHS
jgi:hypothetical protein